MKIKLLFLLSEILLCSCDGFVHRTVCDENQLDRFVGLGDKVQVTAILYAYKYQNGENGDLDYHLNLTDSIGSKCFMIAEIMPGTEAASEFKLLRKKWGSPPTYEGAGWTPIRITVKGLQYYDVEHNQDGTAINNIEVHPVQSISETE